LQFNAFRDTQPATFDKSKNFVYFDASGLALGHFPKREVVALTLKTKGAVEGIAFFLTPAIS